MIKTYVHEPETQIEEVLRHEDISTTTKKELIDMFKGKSRKLIFSFEEFECKTKYEIYTVEGEKIYVPELSDFEKGLFWEYYDKFKEEVTK